MAERVVLCDHPVDRSKRMAVRIPWQFGRAVISRAADA
jgi:hypothetical protein